MSSKLLDAKTTDGLGTAATVTGGTTLLLSGTLGAGASVTITAAPTDALGFLNRSQVINLGRSDAAVQLQAELKNAGIGTNVTLFMI